MAKKKMATNTRKMITVLKKFSPGLVNVPKTIIEHAIIEAIAGIHSRRALAGEIAKGLFTDGNGVLANRLVLEYGESKGESGLCWSAVIDRIEQGITPPAKGASEC